MGHSGIYILIHFYDSAAKYIWSIGNKINDRHKAVAVLTLNKLLFDASLLLLHDATSVFANRTRPELKSEEETSFFLTSWVAHFLRCMFSIKRSRCYGVFCFRHWRGQKSHPMWPREWNHVRFWVMEEDILCCPSSPSPSPPAACSFAHGSIRSIPDGCPQMGGRLKMLPELSEHRQQMLVETSGLELEYRPI